MNILLPKFRHTLLTTFYLLLATVLFLLIAPKAAHAANLYWVGANGAATDVASNWKTTDPSGCGSGDASAAPGGSDVAIFDADCDNGAAVTTSFSVQGVNMQSGYTGTVTQNAVAMTLGSSGWTQAGGTFTGNADGSDADFTLASGGDFLMNGGTFTATNDRTTIVDNFTLNNGTFNHGSGEMYLDADGDDSMVLGGGVIIFYDVTFPNGCLGTWTYTIAAGASLFITNTLTIGGGCAGYDINGPGLLYAQGNINLDSNGFCDNSDPIPTVVLVINGTGTQTITGQSDGDTPCLPATYINKTSGTLNIVDTISIVGDLTTTAGTVSAASSTVVFFGANGSNNDISGSITLGTVHIGYDACVSSFAYTIADGTTLTVADDFFAQTACGTGTLDATGTGNLVVQGDVLVENNGLAGTVPITLSGTAAQSITHNDGGSFPTGTFTINKTTGTVTLGTALALSGSGQDLTITSGKLDMSTFGLTVDDALTVNGSFKQGSGNLVMTAGTMTVGSTGSFINNSTGDISFVGGQGITNNGYVRLDGGVAGCNDGAGDGISITRASGASQVALGGTGKWRINDTTLGTNSAFTASPALVFRSSTIGTGQTGISNNNTCLAERTWDGGAATTAWATTGNWSSDGGSESVPGTTTLVIFDDTSDQSATTPTSSTTLLGIEMRYGYDGTLTQGSGGSSDLIVENSGFLQQSGTFSGGSAAINIDETNFVGDFVLTGGTFTSTSGTLTIADEYSHSGGTFTHSSGTVEFIACHGCDHNLAGTTTFNNVHFNQTCQAYTLTLTSGVFTVNGTLTFESASGCFYTSIDGPGEIRAKGNINLIDGGAKGTVDVIVDGTGAQTIDGEADDNNFIPDLVINKASGDLTLTDQISEEGEWTFTTMGSGSLVVTGSTVHFRTCHNCDITISGSHTLNNVTFNNYLNASSATFPSGTVLTVNGTLTLGRDPGGFGYDLWGPGVIEAKGNVVVNNDGVSGDAAINLTGTANQTFTAGSTFPEGTITINKSSGTVTLGSNTNLAGDGQDLLISNGTLDLSTFTLTINDTLTVAKGGVLKSYTGGDVVSGSGGVINNGQINLGNPLTCGAADSSAITSSSGGAARTWSGNGYFNLFDVAVTDQTESPAKNRAVVWNGTNNGNNNFRFNANCPTPAGVHWKFDEGQGTSANDSSGNSVTGTLAGASVPTWQTEDQCISGKCLSYNGTSSHVTVATVVPQVQTVSMWVRPTSVADIALLDLDGGTHRITVSTGTISATGFTSPTIYVNGKVSSTLVANQWQLVTVTTGTAFATTSGQTIGRYSSTYFPGFIDEVKLYSFALSSTQVKSEFATRGAGDITSGVLGTNTQNNFALSQGLVGYWEMDESSWTVDCSTQSVLDSSGNGLTGEACPNSTGPNGGDVGKFGTGNDFDGNNDYVNLTDSSKLSITPTGKYTWAFWANPDDFEEWNAAWFQNTTGNANELSIHIHSTSAPEPGPVTEGISFAWIEDSGTNKISGHSTDNVLTAGTWSHITVTYDGSQSAADRFRIFVNGIDRTDTSDIYTAGTLAGIDFENHWIGGSEPEFSGENFDGDMDEVRFYERNLSTDEVEQLYQWAPGPVGYWKLDEGSGTNAVDSSGNGNNGTITAGVGSYVNGKYGKGFNFDAANSVINAGSGSSLDNLSAGGMSIEAWIYPESMGENGAGFIVAKNTGGTQSAGWLFLACTTACGGGLSNMLQFTVDGSTDLVVNTANNTLTANRWHHIALSWNGTFTSAASVNIYVNGVKAALQASTNGVNRVSENTATNMWIGNSSGQTSTFDGTIDELKIYNYPRTPAQIIESMNAGHPAPGSPVGTPYGNWRFDEGALNTCTGATYDVCNSGNGGSALHGQFTGTPSFTNDAKFGKAVSFDGSTNNADLSALEGTESTNQISWSMWVKPTTLSTNDCLFCKIQAPTGAVSGAIWGIITDGTDSSQVKVIIPNATNSVASYGTTPAGTLANGTWTHLLFVYDGTQATDATKLVAYVNGKKTALTFSGTAIPSSTTTSTTGGRIASDSQGTANFFNGVFDEIKVYLQPLTEAQVGLDMNQGKAQVLGAISTSSDSLPQSAASEYCPPDSSVSICTGPAAEWKFDETVAGTTVYDTSNNGTNGVISGGTRVNGKFNKAVNYDGNDDVTTVGNVAAIDLNTNSGFTYEAWVWADNAGEGSGGQILNKSSAQTGANATYLRVDNLTGSTLDVEANLDLVTTDANLNISAAITTNSWNHIAFSYTDDADDEITIYVNGINKGTSNGGNGSIPADTFTLNIGGQTLNNFDGKIDTFRFFGYERTAAQIAWSYNGGGPIAWWKMDECQGTAINDNSGFAYHGTWSGAAGGNTSAGNCQSAGTAWGDGVSGRRNYSLEFDGTDDMVSVTDNTTLALTNNMTLAAWVKFNSVAAEATIISRHDHNNTEGYALLMNSTPNFNFRFYDSTIRGVTGTSTVTSGQWYFVVGTYDGTTARIYVNGKLEASSTYSGSADVSDDSLKIGRAANTGAGSFFMNGQIDDARIYNYPFTATQVQLLYNDGAVSYQPASGAP